MDIWSQDFYRIRKKVVTVGNKYWIEDRKGNTLGFCKQKLLKLKEDMRIYSDEKMRGELFCIKQKQIADIWGNFSVIDSNTDSTLGHIKRRALSSTFVKDEWEIYDPSDRQIGKISESSGRGLARKYIPGGSIIPEEVSLEIEGQEVAKIIQKFKIIGDIWEVDCSRVPKEFDRRMLLSCILLMGTIERARK
jgi:uncharacterized protein YxjI